MLTGHVPFPAGSSIQKLIAHRLSDPPPITQERPDVPNGVATVVQKLLAKKPGDRFQTPGELAKALEAVLVQLPPDAVDLNWQPPTVQEEVAAAPEPAQAAAEEGTIIPIWLIGLVVFVVVFLVLLKVL
jgi:hypothetical protein